MDAEGARTLVAEFRRTAKAAAGIKPDVDAALVAAGETICRQVDATLDDPAATQTDRTKALYLLPHLVNILREMEATPKARSEAKVVPPVTGGATKSGTAGRRARAAQRRSQAAEQA